MKWGIISIFMLIWPNLNRCIVISSISMGDSTCFLCPSAQSARAMGDSSLFRSQHMELFLQEASPAPAQCLTLPLFSYPFIILAFARKENILPVNIAHVTVVCRITFHSGTSVCLMPVPQLPSKADIRNPLRCLLMKSTPIWTPASPRGKCSREGRRAAGASAFHSCSWQFGSTSSLSWCSAEVCGNHRR